MEAAFGWIGDVLRWMVCFLPHLGLCRATHGGVKFVRGWKVKKISPGLFWYWPAVTEVELIPVCRHPVDLPAQTFTTSDGHTVLISVTLVIEISDTIRALGKTWDIDDMIMDVGAAAATECIPSMRWDAVRKGFKNGLFDKLAKAARNLLRPYGVRVIKARITDCSEATVIRHEGGPVNVVPIPDEE